MSDSHWLDRFDGFAELREAVDGASLDIAWVDSEDEARDQAPDTEHMPMGTLWTQGVWELNLEMARHKLLVATGGYALLNGMGLDIEPAWYIDEQDPSKIWLAASSSVPPVYWIDVELDADAMRDALQSLMPPPEEAPRKQLRAIMGYEQGLVVPNVYSGQLEEASPEALTNFWIFSPFRFAVMHGWMTYFSRSWAGYDMHSGRLYIWNVDYVPAPPSHQRVVRRVSDANGFAYPEDMPIDLLGVVVGFDFATAELLQNQLEDTPDDDFLASVIVGLGALRYDDPDLDELIRPYMTHESESVRRAAFHVCYSYGLGDLMQEALASETVEDLREWLEEGPAEDTPLIWELPWG